MNGAYSSPLPFGLDFCRSNNTYRGYMPVQCCFFDRVQRDISVWGRGKPPEAPFAGTNFSNAQDNNLRIGNSRARREWLVPLPKPSVPEYSRNGYP